MSALNGLILPGNYSKWLGRDFGSLCYKGQDQRSRCLEMLEQICEEVFIACSKEQELFIRPTMPVLYDVVPCIGPMTGFVSAYQYDPDAAWCIVACDLPLLSLDDLQMLLEHRSAEHDAVIFLHPQTYAKEPLCAIWEKEGMRKIVEHALQGQYDLETALEQVDAFFLTPSRKDALLQLKTLEDYRLALDKLAEEAS